MTEQHKTNCNCLNVSQVDRSPRGSCNVDRIVSCYQLCRTCKEVEVITSLTEDDVLLSQETKTVTVEENVLNFLSYKTRLRVSSVITNQTVSPIYSFVFKGTICLTYQLVWHCLLIKLKLQARCNSFFPHTRTRGCATFCFKLNPHVISIYNITIVHFNYITVVTLVR